MTRRDPEPQTIYAFFSIENCDVAENDSEQKKILKALISIFENFSNKLPLTNEQANKLDHFASVVIALTDPNQANQITQPGSLLSDAVLKEFESTAVRKLIPRKLLPGKSYNDSLTPLIDCCRSYDPNNLARAATAFKNYIRLETSSNDDHNTIIELMRPLIPHELSSTSTDDTTVMTEEAFHAMRESSAIRLCQHVGRYDEGEYDDDVNAITRALQYIKTQRIPRDTNSRDLIPFIASHQDTNLLHTAVENGANLFGCFTAYHEGEEPNIIAFFTHPVSARAYGLCLDAIQTIFQVMHEFGRKIHEHNGDLSGNQAGKLQRFTDILVTLAAADLNDFNTFTADDALRRLSTRRGNVGGHQAKLQALITWIYPHWKKIGDPREGRSEERLDALCQAARIYLVYVQHDHVVEYITNDYYPAAIEDDLDSYGPEIRQANRVMKDRLNPGQEIRDVTSLWGGSSTSDNASVTSSPSGSSIASLGSSNGSS